MKEQNSPMNDEELKEEIESALMLYCELAVMGDPEKELNRATIIIFDLIASRDQQIALAAMEKSKSICGCLMCEHHSTAYVLHLQREEATLKQALEEKL